ncbi:MAG: DUF1643 domain-containing protein [Pseudomonadota bacterium]
MSRNRNTAQLSRCRRYRYALWRTWDRALPRVLFIGLNPSTADESIDDPTLVRCMRFARDWGYGGVSIGNLFAYRATQPADLKQASHPIGVRNDDWLARLAAEAALTVAAWGNDGAWMNRATAVRASLTDLHCLKLNDTGEPAHPLYQRRDRVPLPLPRTP